jgi:hypothetical protein
LEALRLRQVSRNCTQVGNPYRRILAAKITICLRRGSQDGTQPVPESTAINQPGRKCRESRAAAGKTKMGGKFTHKTGILGQGKQTDVRQAGSRRKSSIRRGSLNGRSSVPTRSWSLRQNPNAGAPLSGLPIQCPRPRQVWVAKQTMKSNVRV